MKNLFFFILFFLITINLHALDINETIENTIKNNPKVKISLEKLNESKELIEYATGEKLPTVIGTISGTYAKSELKATTGTTTPESFTDEYKLTVTQNLFDAGYSDLEIERFYLR